MIMSTLSHLRAGLVISLALLAVACTSSPPKPDVDFMPGYNFSEVKNVAFYKDSGDVSGDNPLQLSDMQRNRINEALAQALDKKGLIFVADPADADLMISWHLATQNKTDVRSYQSAGYGGAGYYPYNRYSRYNCWSCMPSQTQVSVQNYTQGTFIVDMIDPELKQSVWRGVTQSKLKGEVNQDQGKYNAAADRIFASFPPP